MWIANNWKDYEVIDTSDGEKLERWGDYILVRPDPQVIWHTPKKDKRWNKLNGHYYRSKKGGGQWDFFDLPEQWSINYKVLTFNHLVSNIQVYFLNRQQIGIGVLKKLKMPVDQLKY